MGDEKNDNEETDKEKQQQSEGTKLANEDVQRAIEGLAEIPDDQLQEFLNDEDFMEGLDVVDAWEGDTDKTRKRSRPRYRDRDRAKSSRERPRRDRKSPHNRERSRREERKREDVRRDPTKSSKDIERDKIRTKKDTASKILAEKEKAIKHLLDSDNVVPPGTEVEVIKAITEKQNSERLQTRSRRSRDRRRSQERQTRQSPPRRRSNDRIRLSPSRRISDERRQIRLSLERRRTAASPPLRRSWERRASRDRSLERQRRREERELRLAARRSRSRDRQRSRSLDHYRKRWSRSPNARRSSPRRHSRTRSRSRSRTPDRRARKRSPFINELARQFGKEGLIPGGTSSGFLPGIPPLMAPGFSQEQASPVPQQTPVAALQQFMHHPGPTTGPSGIHMQPGLTSFVNFEPRPQIGPPINFEPGRGPLLHTPQSDYVSGPIMYNPGSSARPMQPSLIGPSILTLPMHSPQPVPAPEPNEHQTLNFNQNRCANNIPAQTQQEQQHTGGSEVTGRRQKSKKYKNLETTIYNGAEATRSDRLKTPEPPVISNSKPFEKTSLSSLLEASVSAKDSLGLPVLYPGFKPEILRRCELALRELPPEDLRFKTIGRFFFDPTKEDSQPGSETTTSNSILLQTGRSRICWEDGDKVQQTTETTRPIAETHQKTCQTDEIVTESKGVQATALTKTSEFCQQVYPNDLQHVAKEEKRTIMDRLDWNVRETYDYGSKIREADDLRWSLSNSSQKRGNWTRGISPNVDIDEVRRLSPPIITHDHSSNPHNALPGGRSRDGYSYDRSSSREHYSRERFSPTSYRRSMERQEDFHDSRSNHSRGESPMALEESPDEVELIEEDHYPRGSSDWRSRGSTSFASTSALQKIRAMRGKTTGRSYRGRGGFRGKF